MNPLDAVLPSLVDSAFPIIRDKPDEPDSPLLLRLLNPIVYGQRKTEDGKIKFPHCDRCGIRIRATDDHGEPPLTLCRKCREGYYDHCAACGCFAERELLHYPANSDKGYCDECYAYYSQNN